MALSSKQLKTLELICNTLCPSLESDHDDEKPFFAHSASDSEVHLHFERRLEAANLVEQSRIGRVLRLIEYPIICWLFTKRFRSFSKLGLDDRSEILRRWRDSQSPDLRKLFQSIKRLTFFLTYAKPADGTTTNPTWNTIDYPGRNPLAANREKTELVPVWNCGEQSVVNCDVLIIGSGAGGSVVAANLARAGLDCVVAEKGKLFQRDELGLSEYHGNRTLFDKYGSLSTDDLSVVILSGSTVGGGTTVNWMTSLRPDAKVLRQWADDFGFDAAVDGRLSECFNHVEKRLSVGHQQNVLNRQNQILKNGCQALGLETVDIPRNAIDCGDCGFCGYGCRKTGKQDTPSTFLQDAIAAKTRIATELEITKINIESGKVVGAQGKLTVGNSSRPIEIKCNAVVCAGGAIQTPALLLRSGLKHPHLGQNLFLHPTTAIVAFHSEPVEAWSGQPQTVLCDAFSDLDGSGYGVRLEVAPLHPGFGGLGLAWNHPQQHKQMMKNLKYMANTIVLCRDQSGGKVSLDHAGQPKVSYRLGQQESRFLLRGSYEALKIQHAAGAHTVVGPHQQLLYWTNSQNGFLAGEDIRLDSVTDFEAALQNLGTRTNHLSLFSAHQMSTCRIAAKPELGPLTIEGCWQNVQNLYVCDGSVLPTSCGVNPMITIMGLAQHIGNSICQNLGS